MGARLWGRTGAAALAALGALALVVTGVLTGCASPAPGAPAATATAAAGHTPTPTPTVAWVTYRTADGLASWQLPPDWTVTAQSLEPGEWVAPLRYEAQAPDGAVRVIFGDTIMGLGGPGCVPGYNPPYPYRILDHHEIDLPVVPSQYPGEVSPRVAYEQIQYPDHVGGELSLLTALAPDGVDCAMPDFVATETGAGTVEFAAQYRDPGGDWGDKSFASTADAAAYTDTPEYATLVRILTSLRLAQASG